MAARIASAVGDPAALLALAIELNASLSVATSELAALEAIRMHAREKKRRQRGVVSRDVPGQTGTGGDNPRTPSPQVSSSSPTPLITPSFPPSPLPPQAPQGNAEEVRLHERAPEAWPVVQQFLEGKEAPARMAWIGRFHGAMDRPPHPSGAELRDAIGDLMTQPAADWKPALFRRYVDRIRNDANRSAERANAPATPRSVGKVDPVADAAWQATLALLPQWQRREIDADRYATLPAGMRAGLSRIGGFQKIAATPDDKRVWLRNDFVAAFRAAPADPVEAASA